ncbi:MAG: type III pantothenate kinase [Bacteroidales bacterium]|nr:type III pantothenate kinase [Bacteroidales bacterium]
MDNLIVEIGNTALKAAWATGGTLGKTLRYQGERTLDFIRSITEKQLPNVLVLASVRPLSGEERTALEGECRHLLVLDPGNCPFAERYDLPDYLGYDRVASLLAARYLFKGKACTVFDFGTTLKVDFLSAEGRYTGGNISLGCRMRFKALARYSEYKKELNIPAQVAAQGTSVESSIEAGVISGIMFEIDGYVRNFPAGIILFTGGDAMYFAKRMKQSVFVVNNLVLMGLALMTEEYVEKYME